MTSPEGDPRRKGGPGKNPEQGQQQDPPAWPTDIGPRALPAGEERTSDAPQPAPQGEDPAASRFSLGMKDLRRLLGKLTNRLDETELPIPDKAQDIRKGEFVIEIGEPEFAKTDPPLPWGEKIDWRALPGVRGPGKIREEFIRFDPYTEIDRPNRTKRSGIEPEGQDRDLPRDKSGNVAPGFRGAKDPRREEPLRIDPSEFFPPENDAPGAVERFGGARFADMDLGDDPVGDSLPKRMRRLDDILGKLIEESDYNVKRERFDREFIIEPPQEEQEIPLEEPSGPRIIIDGQAVDIDGFLQGGGGVSFTSGPDGPIVTPIEPGMTEQNTFFFGGERDGDLETNIFYRDERPPMTEPRWEFTDSTEPEDRDDDRDR